MAPDWLKSGKNSSTLDKVDKPRCTWPVSSQIQVPRKAGQSQDSWRLFLLFFSVYLLAVQNVPDIPVLG